jgi:hypothetical protein
VIRGYLQGSENGRVVTIVTNTSFSVFIQTDVYHVSAFSDFTIGERNIFPYHDNIIVEDEFDGNRKPILTEI